MASKKSTAIQKPKAGAKVVATYRDAKSGRFTTIQSVRSIKRNSKKYAAVLERLAKR